MSFYSRVTDITQERDGWGDCVFRSKKKSFRHSSPQQATMEARKYRRIKWKNSKLDGKLLKEERSENSGERCKIKMEKSR